MKKFFVVAVAVVVIAFVAIGMYITNHSEVITDNHLTVAEFLADRGIEVIDNPKADEIYPVVLVSDRPLEKKSYRDALYDSGGHIYILFTNTPE